MLATLPICSMLIANPLSWHSGIFWKSHRKMVLGTLDTCSKLIPIILPFVHRYHSVLLMDCTYKMNKFKMPLLHIIRMTSFNTTFSSCFAFLKEEKEDDYEWALTCVQRLFLNSPTPRVIVTDRELALMCAIEGVFLMAQNLLCLWHIEKNILTNCRKHFTTDEHWERFLSWWQQMTMAKTEFNFE